jgi:hypothetical protein
MFCSNCGKPIPDFSRFCPDCGSSLANSRTSAVAQQALPPMPPQARPQFHQPSPQFQPPAAPHRPPPPPYGMSGVGTRDQQPRGNLIYPRNPPISPHLAWLSILICGLPQLIYGQVAKGFLLFILCVILIPTVFGPPVLVLVAIIDAYMVANTLKAGKPVSKWACFPSA